ncbi:hypothetical protein ACTA71_003873 [Dictyostelium dimigraforme]
MIDKLKVNYFFPNFIQQIAKFTEACVECQRNRIDSIRSGLLNPLPIPSRPWNDQKKGGRGAINKIFVNENRKTLQSFCDGILAHSTTIDDHINHLENIFKKMKENNLLAKLSKCQFFQKQINYSSNEYSRQHGSC